MFLMGCNKKLYNVLGGVYVYYNTIRPSISVAKEEKNITGFVYKMKGGNWDIRQMLTVKIDKRRGKGGARFGSP